MLFLAGIWKVFSQTTGIYSPRLAIKVCWTEVTSLVFRRFLNLKLFQTVSIFFLRLKECGEDMLVDMSEILFNELAFFRLMQDLDKWVIPFTRTSPFWIFVSNVVTLIVAYLNVFNYFFWTLNLILVFIYFCSTGGQNRRAFWRQVCISSFWNIYHYSRAFLYGHLCGTDTSLITTVSYVPTKFSYISSIISKPL